MMQSKSCPRMLRSHVCLTLWCLACACAGRIQAQNPLGVNHPRADAAPTAQHLTTALDRSLAAFAPAIPALAGSRGEMVTPCSPYMLRPR